MARTRLSMRKIREVLRLKASGLSYRAIARACLIGKETVREYLGRAAEAGLSWPLPEGLSEEELERRLFPNEPVSVRKESEPDWALVHRELRKKGVTRQLLWEEYRAAEVQGYRYSQYCERYRRWTKALTPVLRIAHKAGEKMFVDYAGMTVPYTERETGEAREAAVKVVEMLLARLRKRQFFSLEEINAALGPLVDALNDRVMEHLGKSRRRLYEELAKPHGNLRGPGYYS